MLETIAQRLESVLPGPSECTYAAARFVQERSERIAVRQNVVQPLAAGIDMGAMITVMHGGGYGYAATSDLTESGLAAAVGRARAWAAKTAPRAIDYAGIALPHPRGAYRTEVKKRWDEREPRRQDRPSLRLLAPAQRSTRTSSTGKRRSGASSKRRSS